MPFSGFPASKVHLIPIPAPFFTELLPEIDHLGELKLSLYAIWFLNQQAGEFRYLTVDDLREDVVFMSGMGASEEAALAAVSDALERAVIRGTLLQASLSAGEQSERLYFLNSPRGRAAVAALQAGAWAPGGVQREEIHLDAARPNIFRLYEQNIGPLTPLMADALREAEELYPAEWIEEAISAAVKANARSWRYAEAILKRREKGRDGTARGKTEKSSRRYVEGELGEFVEH